MNVRFLYFLLGIALILGAIAGGFLFACEDDWCFLFDWQKIRRTQTFEDCVRFGFPVMESYPRQCRAGSNLFVETVSPPDQQAPASLRTIQPNDSIVSPLTLEGQARGSWYFEATFPVKIIDQTNNVLGQGSVQAQGEWMTQEFVPFIGTIIFNAGTATQGFIVLEKNNASGLPEQEGEVRIPVRFNTP